jgi:hypothetical protein
MNSDRPSLMRFPHAARPHRSLAERQLQRARRWQRVAVVCGTLAAALLITIGLHLELRLEATQLVVRWGNPPSAGTSEEPVETQDRRGARPTLPPESTETELRILSDLIHALKQDADERDQRFVERLNHLEKHVRALQSQSELRWRATEENVAALYLLSGKGDEP